MNDLGRLWNRLQEIVSPPKYPEYTEYRDESSSSEPVSDDAVTLKIQRLRLAAGFIILLCVGVAIYLYSIKDSNVTKVKTREVLAAELMKEVLPEDEAPKPESLDDIKKWAQQMEAAAIKDADSGGTRTPATGGRGSSQYDVGYGAIGASRDRGRVNSFAEVPGNYEVVAREPARMERDTAYAFSSTTSAAVPTANPSPARSEYSSQSSTTPSIPREPDRATPSPAAQPHVVPPTDTPGARYQRRIVEPIVIQPRTVEAY